MSSKKALNAIAKAAKEAAEAGLNDSSTNKHIWSNGDLVKNPKYSGPAASNAKKVTPQQMSDFIGQHAAGNHGAKLDDFNNGLRINQPDGRPRTANMHEIPQSQGGTGPDVDNYMTKGFGGGEKNYMTKGDDSLTKFNAKDFYGKGGSIKKTTLGKGGLSDDDINVIGFTGAAGAGLGEGISRAMDDSYSAGKQNAQSYWTNKKNTDRGGK